MSPRDADETSGAEIVDEREMTVVELTGTETREQATQHLREALAATEPAEKQFHIRQGLQLLDVEEW